MKAARAEIARLEHLVRGVGALDRASEIVQLRAARQRLAEARFQLAQRTPGGYAAISSPPFGVPDNPIFVGRRQELVEVGRALATGRPVVIWGPGGLGKTALAIEAVHRQSWRYPGGVLWLDCRNGPALESLLKQIGGFCGIPDLDQTPPDEKEARVRQALAGLEARCLLVWDNAEDVWDVAAVRRFIRNGLPANCQSLLTTRLNPRQLDWKLVELKPLPENLMRLLFAQLAHNVGFRLRSQEDGVRLDDILGMLQGHPLALRSIVDLLVTRGVGRIWRDFQQRPPKDIQEIFQISYDYLTATQKQLFTRMSVFTIPFTWEAVESLLPDADGIDDALDVLVNRSFIQFDQVDWYSFHALIRQFAYTRLQEREEAPAVHRLAEAYLQGKLTSAGGAPEEALEMVDQWEKAAAWEELVRSASALVGSLDRLGYWGEIETRLLRAQRALAHLDNATRWQASLLNDRAIIAHKSARWDEAVTLWEQVLQIDEQVGDIHGMAQIYGNLGNVYRAKGEWDRAIALYQQSRQILEQVGDTHGMATTYNNLGLVYQAKGEWDRAIDFYQQSRQIYEQVGDIHGLASTYNNLGNVYQAKGEWDRAIDFYQQSLQTFEQVGDIHGMAQTYYNLGNVYQAKGEWDRAIGFYQQSLQIKEQVGDIHGMAQTYYNLGLVYRAKGEWDRAIDFYQQSLQTFEQVGDIHGWAYTNAALGQFYQAQGDRDQAAWHTALAWLVFARMDAEYDWQRAGSQLVDILGSVEAAQAYLDQMSQQATDDEQAADDV